MTIKQAFEKLTATCSAGMKNPFFIMRNLHDAFADISDKIVDAQGDKVTVTQTLTEGTEIGSINVNNNATILYAPAGSSGVEYVAAETKIGTFLGNDLYRQVIHSTDSISLSANQTADIAIVENVIPRNMYVMALENGIWYKLPTEGLMVNYNVSSGKCQLYAKTSWAITEIYFVIEYEKISV